MRFFVFVGLAILLTSPNGREMEVGKNVQFLVTKSGRFSPVLPVEMEVEQESSTTGEPVKPGVVTCTTLAREADSGQFFTILRCDKGVFLLKKVDFASSR